jgi:hypothetical protein
LYRSGAYKICGSPVVSLNFDESLIVELPFFLSKQVLFPSSCLPVFIHCSELCSSGSVLNLDRPRSCAVLFLINRGTLLVKPLLVLLFSRIAHDSGGYILYFFFSFIPKFIEAACLNVVLIDIDQDIIAEAEKFRMVAPESII